MEETMRTGDDMELTVRRLKRETLTREAYFRLAEILRAGRRRYLPGEEILVWLDRFRVYACFDGDYMAALIALDPGCRYFGGSIGIAALRPDWEYNTDEVLRFLICHAAAACGGAGKYVTVDAPGEHFAYRKLYRDLGFVPSASLSALGRNYTVLMIAGEKLH